jgi:hypothetical protein
MVGDLVSSSATLVETLQLLIRRIPARSRGISFNKRPISFSGFERSNSYYKLPSKPLLEEPVIQFG